MLVIQGGRVLDPQNGLDQGTDVVVEEGHIVHVGSSDAAHINANVIDADGCIVTPGLIDHHAHLYPFAKIGIPAESVCYSSGVTTAVDAGSTGCANYRERSVLRAMTKLTILAYLNVCSTGLDSLPVLEDVDPAHWETERIKECFQENASELLGLKIRTSAPIVKELGFTPVRAAVSLGDHLGVPVMVHCTNPPGALDTLLDLLRPGDILTHMYMDQGSSLISKNKVIDSAYRARARGVLFEAADARMHFGLRTAISAIREGFYPDIVATDLTKLSMYLRPTAFSLAMQVAKYAALGIPLAKVIAACTIVPAHSMGISERAGSLTLGRAADIAVFRPVRQDNVFGDRPYDAPVQNTLTGDTLYQPVLTVKDGETVFRDVTF